MSLPLLLGIVATDKSLVDNEGAIRGIGVGGNKKGELSRASRIATVGS